MRAATLTALCIITLFHFTVAQAAKPKARDLIVKFDESFYHPANYGLSDLYFKLRVSNLKEMLNAQKSYGKIDDVYFDIYWMAPGKFEIEVQGLPNGFDQIKNGLKQMVLSRMDFVVPEKMQPKLRGYTQTVEENKSGYVLKGVDKTYTKNITEVFMRFDKSGKLTSYNTKAASGTMKVNFDMSSEKGSHNKWLIKKMEVESFQGARVAKTTNTAKYLQMEGVVLPKEISIKTEIKVNVPQKNMKKEDPPRVVQHSLIFSDYEVNTGKAMKKITSKK